VPRVPLLRLLLPYALGIAAEDWLFAPIGATAALVVAGALVWGTGRFRSGEALLGIGLGALSLAVCLHAPIPAVGAAAVRLTALDVPRLAGPVCSLVVQVHGIRPGRALLRLPAERCAILPGERLLARLALEPMRPRTNPGGSDPRRRWRRRGVRAYASLVDGAMVSAGVPASLAASVGRRRAQTAAALDPPDSPSRAGAVLRALVTGDRSRLTARVREPFVRSGTAHLLAVSGLHVGWVFALTQAAVCWLLRRLPGLWLLRRAGDLGLLAGAVCAAGYAALAGFGVPALRAAAMALAGTVAVLAGRPSLGANALSGAALLVLACAPRSLFEPAFALSFAAVGGILLWRPPRGRVAATLHATAAAGLATAPLVAAIGAPLPAGSLLANLFAIPVFAAGVVPLALVTGLAAAAWPGAGEALRPLATGACELSLRLVEALGSPDLLAGASQPELRAAGLCVAGFAARSALRVGQPRAACALAATALAVLLVPAPAPGTLAPPSVTALDVGHGDALLVRAAGRNWLVDAGSGGAGFDAGRAIVRPALRALGVQRLDVLVLTHSDRDHLGGAAAILAHVPVREVWLGAATRRHPAARALRRAAARRGVPLRVVAAGFRRREAGFDVRVLWPPAAERLRTSNETSLVLRIELAAGCLWLSGDAPSRVERRLAAGQAPCAFLKLGHHGSRSSSAAQLLERLSALVAVASSGQHARWRLPHPEVRERLAAHSLSLYETARTGALRVTFGPSPPVAEPFLLRDWRHDMDGELHSGDGEATPGR
jgi:competence protein ComEC